MAYLPHLGSVPAAYAVVAGACDWPLQYAVDLFNNFVIALRSLCCVRCVGWKPRLYKSGASCVWTVAQYVHQSTWPQICRHNSSCLRYVWQEIWANVHETRDSISLISYSSCIGLSPVISSKIHS